MACDFLGGLVERFCNRPYPPRMATLGPACTDPAAMRAAIIEHVGLEMPALAPMRKLSPRERKLLREGDVDEVFAGRRAEILAYSHAALQANPAQVDKFSYGYQVQLKELERWWKLAFPEKLRIEHSGEVQRLEDPALVALLERLGLVAPVMKALTP